jgi:hypothetical protein
MTMPREPEICSTCRAWRRLTNGLPGFVEGEARGECHHNAPFSVTNGGTLPVLCRWPIVLAEDHCLDWQPQRHNQGEGKP